MEYGKEEFVKNTEGEGVRRSVHSLDRLQKDLEDGEKNVANAKKTMLSTFADEEKHKKLQEIVRLLEDMETTFDISTLPSVLKASFSTRVMRVVMLYSAAG